MNRRIALSLAALFFASGLHAAEPATGATRAEIEAELGKPTAVRATPAGDIAVYARGTITYRAGRATELKLVPLDTWLRQIETEKKVAEENRLRAERLAAERARRLAEDEKARDALLAAESYKQLSPAARLARLDALMLDHPLADVALLRADLAKTVAGERSSALRLAEAEAARAESDRKLTELASKLDETRDALDAANRRAEAATRRIEQLELGLRTLAEHYRGMDELVRTQIDTPSGGITTKRVISK